MEEKCLLSKITKEDKLNEMLKFVQRRNKKEQEDREWMDFLLRKEKSANNIYGCGYQANFYASHASNSDSILKNQISVSKQDVCVRSSKSIDDFRNIEKNQIIYSKKSNSHGQKIMENSAYQNGRIIHISKLKSDDDDKTSKNDVVDDSSVDFTFVERITNYRGKMCITLDQIADGMHNIPEPDGARDMARRKQRVLEFASRFCRNYLYQLKREVDDLEKQWRSFSVVPMDNRSEYICHKVITAHQFSLNALQAYYRHMPSSIGIAIPVKLKELLFLICTLIDCCKNFDIDNSLENNGLVLQKKCIFVAELTNSKNLNYVKTVNKVAHKKKESIPARLSMYRERRFVRKKPTTTSVNMKHKITRSKENKSEEQQRRKQNLVEINKNKPSLCCEKQMNIKKLTRNDIPIRGEAKSVKKGIQRCSNNDENTGDSISTVMQSVPSDDLQVEEKLKFGNVLKMPDVSEHSTERVDCSLSQSSNTSVLQNGEYINILHNEIPKSQQRTRSTKQCTIVEPRRNIRLELCQCLDTRVNKQENEVQGQLQLIVSGTGSLNSHLQNDQLSSYGSEREDQINIVHQADKPDSVTTISSDKPLKLITSDQEITSALEYHNDYQRFTESTTKDCNNFVDHSDTIERVSDQFGTMTLEEVIQEVEKSGLLLALIEQELK